MNLHRDSASQHKQLSECEIDEIQLNQRGNQIKKTPRNSREALDYIPRPGFSPAPLF